MPLAPPSAAAVAQLRAQLTGAVDDSLLRRRIHATDASVYEQLPLLVACPASPAEVVYCVQWANSQALPITARGAGTSLAGQTTGGGLVLDLGRHLHRIEAIEAERGRVRVEPGVVLDDLNDELAPTGLFFAPDTSTSNRCMIGGMIGNNSCGAHSVRYGTTRDHVRSLDVVLADGSTTTFAELDAGGFAAKCRQDDHEGAIYRGIDALMRSHRSAILANYPPATVNRRNTGYALDVLAGMQPWQADGRPLNLAPLLCGSEGTLALTVRAELGLLARPRHRLICAVHFNSLVAACEAAVLALEHQCHAAELIDGAILEATKHNPEQRRNRFWIEGEPGAVCAIELEDADAERLQGRMRALVEALQQAGLGHAWPIIDEARGHQLWSLRKAGLGLLMGIVQERKAVAVIEDTAVAPADLPAYIADVQALTARHGVHCVAFGHAAAGELHIRPELDLRRPRDAGLFATIASEVADLVRRYHGSLSGEHGDGRVRAPFIGRVLGEEMVPVLEELKRIFDPRGLLNPGKIVQPEALTKDWRFAPGRQATEIRTSFDWQADGGLLAAAEKCNGAGACRKGSGRGVMCPSYHATGDELHTTRARANILQQLLREPQPHSALSSDAVAEALALCLSCKACKSECPANVDLARLKAEVLQQRHDRLGVPASSRRLGRFGRQARLASRFPGLVNRIATTGLAKRLLGVDPRRDLPPFAAETFISWWARRPVTTTGDLCYLVVDEFSNHLEPALPQAAVVLLEALGYRVEAVLADSQRAELSHGLLREARRGFARELTRFTEALASDAPIVGLEPSAVASFADELPDLLPEPAAQALAKRIRLIDELLADDDDRWQRITWGEQTTRRILLHGHCHQKALFDANASTRLLRRIPQASISELPSGCCGMAGSFGYQYYDVSIAVAEAGLLPLLDAEPEAIIAATGTSCRHQIRDTRARLARHPVLIVAEALSDRGPSARSDAPSPTRTG